MEERQLLRDPEIFPTDSVLEEALKESYNTYQKFIDIIPTMNIDMLWQYYKDGKNWLMKCTAKKKTIFWLSVWDGFFRVTLFFTEKTREGIQELPVSEEIKFKLFHEPIKGKLIPLLLNTSDDTQLKDAIALIAYKQNLK